MAIETVTARPLTPTIGAEIEGIDLRRPITREVFEAVHDALLAHGVIFFRDQDIPVEKQKELGAMFGELVAHPNDPGLPEHPEVMIIHADADSKRVAGESWHSDVSCETEP